jgi:hypothetical protein
MRLVAINIILAISVLGCAPRKPVDPIAQAKYQPTTHAPPKNLKNKKKPIAVVWLKANKQTRVAPLRAGVRSFMKETPLASGARTSLGE